MGREHFSLLGTLGSRIDLLHTYWQRVAKEDAKEDGRGTLILSTDCGLRFNPEQR